MTHRGRGATSPGRRLSRRRVLGQACAVAAGVLAAPFVRSAAAADRTLRVSTYGGNFENSFRKFVFPPFEKASGIKIDSIAQSADLSFLMQIVEANRIGVASIDLCTAAQSDVVRGNRSNAWRPLSTDHIPNIANLNDRYIHRVDKAVIGIGAMAWYQTLIVNPTEVKPLPTSWKILWDGSVPGPWGLAGGGQSTLFEITAATWFGGLDVLDTKDGILKVLAKIAEVKPRVKVWWESEGTMQTAFENDEIVGGMYYHDVAGVMARSGIPVVSVFPAEGGVLDFGSWCQPAASTKTEEAAEFINYMCTPEAQQLMARNVGAAPLLDRKMLNLTDAEFAAVSSEIPPINYAVEARSKFLDFMEDQFTRMLTS